MNAGNGVVPYSIRISLSMMACVHIFLYKPYRQMEEFTRKLSKFVPTNHSH